VDLGLFDAFKKKDRKVNNELDLPPPPPMGGPIDSLPDFPEMNDKTPSFPRAKNDDFDLSAEQEIEGMKMPEFPQIPEMDDSMGTITAPDDNQDEHIDGMDWNADDDSSIESEKPQPMPAPRFQGKAQVPAQKQYAPKQYHASKPVVTSGSTYLKVDDFRMMLGTMSSARSEIRKSEESLSKLETMKSSKDKSFDKIKASLEDIQKKLTFIDKTLFKGE
jgi:hypothetical protein